MTVFRCYLSIGMLMRLRKRAQTTHLASFGPFVSFFKISFVFIVTNDCIRYYLSTGGLREGGGDKNGPKRCQMHRLGHS